MLTVSINGASGVNLYLNRAGSVLITREMLEELGSEAVSMIIKRTRLGVDLGGAYFKPYTKEYEKRKGGRGVVNLTRSGQMLGALRFDVIDGSAVAITIFGNEERARALAHNDTGAGKSRVKRRFIGINEEEGLRLAGMVEKHVGKVMEGGW